MDKIATKAPSWRMHSGFSLIEIMMTLTILLILGSVAAPYFTTMLDKHAVKQTTLLLKTSLSLARQTAISTRHDVYVCALTKENNCNTHRPFNANWGYGWQVFVDINANQSFDQHDEIIQIYRHQKPIGIIFNQRGRLRFRSQGSARSAGFYICNQTKTQHILILYTGRTRIKPLENNEKKQLCLNTIKH